MPTMPDQPTVFRPNSVSYLRIPAPDPATAAAFYGAVFDWEVDPERGRFTDGSGHVIGHFVSDIDIAGEDGVRPYVYVEDVEQTLARLSSLGGSSVTAPYPEGNLTVATFRDPAGNVMGIWQQATP
jgi:predicted enzyme related to lactoylglutathione lyase